MVQGVDLSANQGPNVPWQMMKDAGIAFAFLRCHVGNGSARDAMFARYVGAAMAVGMMIGAYFFPFPLAHLDPIAQVDLWLKSADVLGHPLGADRGELPPVIDAEWPPPEEWQKRGLTADSIVDWLLTCAARVETAYGVAPIFYSYPYYLQALSSAKNFAQLMRYSLWIAGGSGYLSRITPPTAAEKPPIVAGWSSNWLFWQWNGNGGAKLPNGIDADFNAFRYELSDLKALAAGSIIVEAVPDTLPASDLASLAHESAQDQIVEDSVHAYRQQRAQAMLDAAA